MRLRLPCREEAGSSVASSSFSKAGPHCSTTVQHPSLRWTSCVFKRNFALQLICRRRNWFGGRPVSVCARRGFILPGAGAGWRRMRAITRDFRNQRGERWQQSQRQSSHCSRWELVGGRRAVGAACSDLAATVGACSTKWDRGRNR